MGISVMACGLKRAPEANLNLLQLKSYNTLKFGVQWFLNRTNRLTKFHQNFCVDLTVNDPFYVKRSQNVKSV